MMKFLIYILNKKLTYTPCYVLVKINKIMKHLKLFESFLDKEKLKEGYEKFVMSKDYIPNLIEKEIKEAFPYNSPIIDQIKFSVEWKPIPFDKLINFKSNMGLHLGSPNSHLIDVCVAGCLLIIADKYFTRKQDHYSDELAVIMERISSVLAKATQDLDGKLILPPSQYLEDSSHGPICFLRNKTNATNALFTGMPDDDSFPGRKGYSLSSNKKLTITTWLCLDKMEYLGDSF
jgi:hypothetical protein